MNPLCIVQTTQWLLCENLRLDFIGKRCDCCFCLALPCCVWVEFVAKLGKWMPLKYQTVNVCLFVPRHPHVKSLVCVRMDTMHHFIVTR